MKTIYDLLSVESRNVPEALLRELWNVSYSEINRLWYMVYMYAECLDGTKVPLRILYTRNYLNLETELPDDWKHIVLIDFYKGRYDLCKETVVFINNNDGTVIVNQTKVNFKHGPIVKDRKTLMIEGLDRMHRFREHRCDLYTRGWWAFN